MPTAERVEAESISRWANTAGEWLVNALRGHAGPWRLHVFCVPTDDGSATHSRCRYIEEAVTEFLRKKQRRLLRTVTVAHERPMQADEWLLQVGLKTATTGYVSVVTPDTWPAWRRAVSRFPGGVLNVEADRRAPSRAFSKLAEVEVRLARAIEKGETCVDLGSSPGSWAYWALGRGAEVWAVDRAPLRADVMHHRALTFVRGDAFRYRPPRPVDWLLCDVVAFPAKTISLVEEWLAAGWCRFFCVTIKFRGQDEDDKLEPLKAWLASARHDFYLRRLTANKNEVMLFGQAAASNEVLGGL